MTTKRRILHLLSFIIILYINLNQVDAFFERTITLNDKSTVSKWEKSYKFLDSINWSKRYGIEKILSDFRNDSSLSKKLSFTCNQFLDQNFHPNENIRNRFYSNENHSKNWGGKFSKHFNQLIDAWFTSGPSSSPLAGHTSDPGSPVECLSLNGRHSLVQVSLATPGNDHWSLVNNLTTSLRFNISSSNILSNSPQFSYYAERIKYFLIGDLYFGICTPIDCTINDIEHVLNYVSELSESKLRLNKYHQISSSSNDPSLPKENTDTGIKILAWIVFAYFMFVIIASKSYDLIKHGYIKDKIGVSEKILKHFNISENIKILCLKYEKDHYRKMRLLDTTKFYFQIIASALHICIITPCLPIVLPSLKEWRELVHYSAFGNDIWLQFSWGIQLVFAISGFFSCYVVYPILERTRGKLPIHFFVLKRWLRTIPTLIGMIILVLIIPVIIPSNDQGIRSAMDFLSAPCKTNAWQTIFFVNNWNLPLNEICIFQSWFISSDFQLWLLAYWPLIQLYKRPKLGVASCLLIMVAASVSTTFSLYHFELPAFPVGHETDILVSATHSNVMPYWYFTPHNNAFCYFCGILTAFYCLRRKKALKQSSLRWIISWPFFLILGIGVNFFPAFYKHIFHGPESRLIELTYGLIARASVGLYAIILFVTLFNNFHQMAPLKYVIDFLKWDSHAYTILGFVPVNFFPLFLLFLAYNFFCYLFGFFLYLFVEAPSASILSSFTSSFRIQEYELPRNDHDSRIETNEKRNEIRVESEQNGMNDEESIKLNVQTTFNNNQSNSNRQFNVSIPS